MALVKSDRPVGGLPCTDQDRLLSCWAEVLEQPRADAGTLIFGYDIGVADQVHSASVLHTHHTDQAAVGDTGADHDTVSHFRCECFGGHVGFMPPEIGRAACRERVCQYV